MNEYLIWIAVLAVLWIFVITAGVAGVVDMLAREKRPREAEHSTAGQTGRPATAPAEATADVTRVASGPREVTAP